VTEDFTAAALVLVGHGSMANADSSAPVYQHAAEIRRRRLFTEVREAFLKQEPRLETVLGALPARRVVVTPLFISEGYFTDEVIPRLLGLDPEAKSGCSRVRQDGARTLLYCRPVGSHESMTAVLLARARDIVEQHPFPRAPEPAEIGLFIAGHGTERHAQSRRAIERQVERIRALGLYAGVHGVFMEEEPRIAACYSLAPTRNLVIVPFFISDGLHVREDIPMLLGEPERVVRERLSAGQPTWRNPTEIRGRRVWYTPSVGSEPHLADVILERVRELSARA
jgi:sirohydrochlorin cobaltochelatase